MKAQLTEKEKQLEELKKALLDVRQELAETIHKTVEVYLHLHVELHTHVRAQLKSVQ